MVVLRHLVLLLLAVYGFALDANHPEGPGFAMAWPAWIKVLSVVQLALHSALLICPRKA